MTLLEQIYTEIERLEKQPGFCEAGAYDKIRSFLDTLQEQQKDVDLREEIDRFYRTDEYKLAETLGRGFDVIAKHFYELGKQSKQEHPIDSNKMMGKFPQYRNIVDRVFGAGNLESWEYTEAEQLVALAEKEVMQTFNEALELVNEYNLKPYRDGNAWCILLGRDIQSGICGFGNTQTEAYLDFLKSYKEYNHPIGELLAELQDPQGLDEDIITIHLGKVLPEEQYNEVVKSITAFMNTRWPGLLSNQFAN